MRKVILAGLAVVFMSLGCTVASAAPKGVKKHALAKVLMAPVKVASVAPKAAAKGVAYTLGSALFAVESGVDVVHLATDVLDKGVQAEGWKRNVFHYPNVVAGYADEYLEDGYNYFFHVKI